MVANWAIGKQCDVHTFLEKLARATFDVVIIVTTAAVAESDDILLCLRELAGLSRKRFQHIIGEVLKDKQG